MAATEMTSAKVIISRDFARYFHTCRLRSSPPGAARESAVLIVWACGD
jgi:hypothetical protein